MDELSNIPTKAEERSMIQISVRTQDPNIRQAQIIRSPRQKLQLIHDPQCFQNPPIRSIYRKKPQSVRFLRPNPSIRKPIHPLFNIWHRLGVVSLSLSPSCVTRQKTARKIFPRQLLGARSTCLYPRIFPHGLFMVLLDRLS